MLSAEEKALWTRPELALDVIEKAGILCDNEQYRKLPELPALWKAITAWREFVEKVKEEQHAQKKNLRESIKDAEKDFSAQTRERAPKGDS